MKIENVNWKEVQNFYDNNNSWRDIEIEFKISDGTISNAKKKGLFVSRTKSDGMKVANKKNPRKLSEETKNKISKSRTKYLKEHPEQVPYLLNHSSKGPSYPETYFDKIFEEKFKYEKYFQVSLYHIDFAIIDKKIAIEVDGDQHYLDMKIVESDIRKDKYLTDNNWDIIRIRWSSYKKMNRTEKEKYIIELIDYINNLICIKPEIKFFEKRKKEKIEYFEKINLCITCGENSVTRKNSECVKCSHLKQRKVKERPSNEELLKNVQEFGYCKTGRKYGVSDNCIRKWLK